MDTEDWAALKELRARERRKRRGRSGSAFLLAVELARQHGLMLHHHNGGVHFRLQRDCDWVMDVWPSTGRIIGNKTSRRHPNAAPYVELPDEWTILDVVKGVVAAEEVRT